MAKTIKDIPIMVGLTGGIGSGKSTVRKFFEELGFPTLDADSIAREITAPQSPILPKIVEIFGSQALDHEGALKRPWLKKKIFTHPEQRKQLEALLHPEIRRQALKKAQQLAIESTGKIIIYEAPVLLEAGSTSHLKAVICVTAPEDLRIQRITLRNGMPVEQIKQIMRTQMPEEEKIKHADYIIPNEGNEVELRENVQKLVFTLRNRFSS